MLISIKDLILNSWNLYIKKFHYFIPYLLMFIAINLIAITIKYSTSYMSFVLPENLIAGLLVTVLVALLIIIAIIILNIWAGIALAVCIKKIIHNEENNDWKLNLKESVKFIWPSVYTNLLSSLLVLLVPISLSLIAWGVSALLPGIPSSIIIVANIVLILISILVLSIMLVFVLYEIVFNNKKGLSAIISSINMIKNRWWSVFARVVVTLLIFVLIFYVINKIISVPIQIFFSGDLMNVVYLTVTNIINTVISPLASIVIMILYFDIKNKPSQIPEMPEIKKI